MPPCDFSGHAAPGAKKSIPGPKKSSLETPPAKVTETIVRETPRITAEALPEPFTPTAIAPVKDAENGRIEYQLLVELEYPEKMVYVMSGGELSKPAWVSEQYILDLEREAFLSLCGEEKTQERMYYMLENGRPLRN